MAPSTKSNCSRCLFYAKQCERLKRQVALLSKLVCNPPPTWEDNSSQTDPSQTDCVATQTYDSCEEQLFIDKELFETYITEPNVTGNDDQLFKLFVENNVNTPPPSHELVNQAFSQPHSSLHPEADTPPVYMIPGLPFSNFNVLDLDNSTQYSLNLGNRSTAYYGIHPYCYGNITHQPQPLPQDSYITTIIKQVSVKMPSLVFNSILITKYEDGEDFVPLHSDNEKNIEKDSVIACISLGATRGIYFESSTGSNLSVELEHGSVYCMTRKSQDIFRHGVPKRCNSSIRISITLRQLTPEPTVMPLEEAQQAADDNMVCEFLGDLAHHQFQQSPTFPNIHPSRTCPNAPAPLNHQHYDYEQHKQRAQYHNHPTKHHLRSNTGVSVPAPPKTSTTVYISSSMFSGLDENKLSSKHQQAKVLFYRGATAEDILVRLQSDPKFLAINTQQVNKVYLLCGSNNIDRIMGVPHHRRSSFVGVHEFNVPNSHGMEDTKGSIANLTYFLHEWARSATINLINILPRASEARNIIINELNDFMVDLCRQNDSFLYHIGTETSRRLFSNREGYRLEYYFNDKGTDNIHLTHEGVVRLARHLKYLAHN